jgi:hypothetical protein
VYVWFEFGIGTSEKLCDVEMTQQGNIAGQIRSPSIFKGGARLAAITAIECIAIDESLEDGLNSSSRALDIKPRYAIQISSRKNSLPKTQKKHLRPQNVTSGAHNDRFTGSFPPHCPHSRPHSCYQRRSPPGSQAAGSPNPGSLYHKFRPK